MAELQVALIRRAVTLYRNKQQERVDWLRAKAREVGFEVISFGTLLRQSDVEQLTIPALGHCPNVAGQRWLAEQLHTALLAQPKLLGE